MLTLKAVGMELENSVTPVFVVECVNVHVGGNQALERQLSQIHVDGKLGEPQSDKKEKGRI